MLVDWYFPVRFGGTRHVLINAVFLRRARRHFASLVSNLAPKRRSILTPAATKPICQSAGKSPVTGDKRRANIRLISNIEHWRSRLPLIFDFARHIAFKIYCGAGAADAMSILLR